MNGDIVRLYNYIYKNISQLFKGQTGCQCNYEGNFIKRCFNNFFNCFKVMKYSISVRQTWKAADYRSGYLENCVCNLRGNKKYEKFIQAVPIKRIPPTTDEPPFIDIPRNNCVCYP